MRLQSLKQSLASSHYLLVAFFPFALPCITLSNAARFRATAYVLAMFYNLFLSFDVAGCGLHS